MKRHHRKVEGELSLKFVAEAEQRVKQQEQTIVRLKKQGRPTQQAESTLQEFQRSLLGMRNHREIMQELVKPRLL